VTGYKFKLIKKCIHICIGKKFPLGKEISFGGKTTKTVVKKRGKKCERKVGKRKRGY
jgi:hypothetical protein